MSVRILEGDALQVLRTLPDQSVQMCCTSPPYFGLRDYGVAGQLGLEKTPQLYVDAMVGVFSEVKRVLRDDGTLWLNIGDSYAGSWGAQSRPNGSDIKSTLEGGSMLSARQIEAHPRGTQTGSLKNTPGCKPKDLIGIPWMLAFALRADGWYLRSDIIWHKPNPMPESVTDRPTKAHEYLFLLSKSERYYYDADAIAEESLNAGKTVRTNGNDGMDQGYDGHRTRDAFRRGVVVGATRNRRSVWTIPSSPFPDAHFATFPPDLIEPCILAGSAAKACEKCGAPWERDVSRRSMNRNELPKDHPEWRPRRYDDGKAGDPQSPGHGQRFSEVTTLGWKPTCDCENSGTGKSLVLDPFGGAGTTGLVADRLGRDALLIELSPKYAEMARKRIHSDNPLFTDVA